MPNKKITDLALASALSGTEPIEVVQGGANKQTTTQAIANLASGATSQFRGVHDASGNTLPSTGGSGTAGALVAGDEWYISVTGNLDPGDGTGSQAVVVGTIIKYISVGLWRFIQ